MSSQSNRIDTPFPITPYPGDDKMVQLLAQTTEEPLVCRAWQEAELCAVLGKSCKSERDLVEDAIAEDGLMVHRREGGGGTVVLAPGMVIIAVSAHVNQPFGNKRYFQLIQEPIQEYLEIQGLPGVEQSGLSDLSWQGRKILGSSLRRKSSMLLYQAVLLVQADRALFERYLQHPPKEPDYREGRSHQDFTITLEEAGLYLHPEAFALGLQDYMHKKLLVSLAEDFKRP